jgi:DNA/RNA-binding domain of Phe-tRNA-synthetase-like protein
MTAWICVVNGLPYVGNLDPIGARTGELSGEEFFLAKTRREHSRVRECDVRPHAASEGFVSSSSTMQVSIDPLLKQTVPRLALGVIRASVRVSAKNPDLWTAITSRAEMLAGGFALETIVDLPQVKALRQGYRAIGKDPSRYRGSQESLLRRILKGQGLYQINTVVDINNLVSLHSMHSVGSYDLGHVQGDITFRIGRSGESYKGIGRDMINVAELPVLADELGPFGSPTSDSERAMVTLDTVSLLMVITSFAGAADLTHNMDYAISLLRAHAKAADAPIETHIVE